MTDQEWNRVDAAVSAALELSAEQRDRFVAKHLDGREDLIAEARSLLAYDGDPRPDPLAIVGERDWTGRHIGPYKITGKAGEGGMGVVYSAERDDGQFHRQVAVKFLSSLFPLPLTLDRFLLERDILARLDHPNITRLLDAGFAGGHEPYLVMEWVEGKRIDEHVRESGLDLGAILRLFRQVCAAVEYAHRQLVIHKDLKPSNIFVTGGQAKLLDFGVAKLLDPARAANDLTAPMSRILTPDYSSPEQLRGEPVTTLTDVYSLGVALYELLAGKRPFEFGNKTFGQIVEQAGRVQPPKPSSVRRELPHEIDAIVFKAMAPDPAERYGSAAEMAADLDNFLEGRPVKARPASAWYVARKFVRRNWLAVAAAAAAMTLISGSAIVAIRQRNKAEQRFAQLRQLSGAVIFEFEDGISNLPGTLEVRRKMVRRSLNYMDSLADDGQNDPQLLSELAQGYKHLATVQGKPSEANLGDFSGALASAHKAERELERLLVLHPKDFETACDIGDMLFLTGQIQQRVPGEDSAATFRKGVQYWEALASQYPERERVMSGLAGALFYKPDFERALVLYEQLTQRNPQKASYTRNVALMCRYISGTTLKQHDFQKTRRLIDRAVGIDRGRVQAAPLDRLARLDLSFDLSQESSLDVMQHDLRTATRASEEVLAIREELVRLDARDEQAQDRLFYALVELAWLRRQSHDYAAASECYTRAVHLGEALARTNARPNTQFAMTLRSARDGVTWANSQQKSRPGGPGF